MTRASPSTRHGLPQFKRAVVLAGDLQPLREGVAVPQLDALRALREHSS